ncbi:DUF4129 domain-containing protein [Cohnella sp. CFH 77786]|uniref:DUF4129 domain-containing protein n=1 Tax=Cohnella sp. CFH 77786 TaxID=2662265 RepID=UPI001C60E37B|nr:DUF4129 domain-containing protein [Cohnella sp. CFH 77786]
MNRRFNRGGTAVREAAVRAAAAAYELWMLLPLGLLAYRNVPQLAEGVWPWMAAIAALSVCCAALSVHVLALWKQGALALLAAMVAWGIMHAEGSFSPLVPVLLAIAALQGFTIPYRCAKIGWFWTGVGIYFLASVLFRIVPGGERDPAFLTLGGLACLTVAFFAVNRLHLRIIALSTDDPRRVPADLKQHNRLFVAAILGGILLLSAGLGGWMIRGLKSAVRALIVGFLSLFSGGGDPIRPPQSGPATPPPPMELPPAKEPGWFAQLLDQLLPYLAAAVCAALLGWGLYRLYRLGGGRWKRWLSRMAEWLGRSANAPAAAGYTDEQSSVFSWEETLGKLRGGRIGRLLARRWEPGWDELPNNLERARYLYRVWLRAHTRDGYPAAPHLTPRETVQDAKRWRQSRDKRASRSDADSAMDERRLIDVYYKSRYAEEEPTAEELAAVGKPRM